MIKVGIIGGAGYTAGELLRILVNHPEVELVWVHSSSNAGARLSDIHEGLIGETDKLFASDYDLNAIDLLFLCSGHGASTKFWAENERPEGLRVIDLAQDYRDESCGYVYGLPEQQRKSIAEASLIANPGCFATAIQLALLPLAVSNQLVGEIVINGITGSTGAGVKPGSTTHFSWRVDNMSVYKPFKHQHLKEIMMTLSKFENPENFSITFIPMRGNFARGIFLTAVLDTSQSREEVLKIYKNFYSDAQFTHVSDGEVDLKQVVNTNKALIGIDVNDGKLLVTAAIDNLLKGASGQAVQNMNLMFGLEESLGLRLKPSGF